MRICAITMVYKDYWALSQWYAHYSKHIGSQNLYIVAHGHDERISKICPDASIISVPRYGMPGFDRSRAKLLNSIQDGLGVLYDWVIRTDADELICLNPFVYPSFSALFESVAGQSSVFSLGFNLFEDVTDKPFRGSTGVFSSRKHAVFSGHYSKAWAVRRRTHLMDHGVKLTASSVFTLPKGVYLAHLKYANIAALAATNEERLKVSNAKWRNLPGRAWQKAREASDDVLNAFEEFEVVDWDNAESAAYERISSSPIFSRESQTLCTPWFQPEERTILPNWFKKI